MTEEAKLNIVINAQDNASKTLLGLQGNVKLLQGSTKSAEKSNNEFNKSLKKISDTESGMKVPDYAKGLFETVEMVGKIKEIEENIGKIGEKSEEGTKEKFFNISKNVIDAVASAKAITDIAGIDMQISGLLASVPGLREALIAATIITATTSIGMTAYQDYLAELREGLLDSGAGAKYFADQAEEAGKASDSVVDNAKRLNELNEIINSGGEGSKNEINAILSERKQLIEWFNDNYGDYLSNYEKENGINLQKARDLEAIGQDRADYMLMNLNTAIPEAEANIPQLVDEKAVLEDTNNTLVERGALLESVRTDLLGYVQEMQAAEQEYNDGILNEKGYIDKQDEIEKNYKHLIEDYQKVFGSELANPFTDMHDVYTGELNNYEEVIGRISELITENEGQIAQNNQDIDRVIASIEGYKEAARFVNDELIKRLPEAMAQGDETVQEYLSNIGRYGRAVGLSAAEMTGYAQAAALAMSGTESLNEVWEAGGTRLDNFVNNYVTAMNEFGASGEQTAIGAALIKNGFNDLTQATEAGKLNVIVQQANELAHALGLIPEEKNIEINAEGNVTLVESVEAKVKSLDGKTFAVTVDTNGDTSKLDEASKKIIELDGKRCTIVMTADGKPAIAEIDGVDYKLKNYNNETGTATLIAENGEAIGVIDFTTGQIFAMNSVVGIGHIKALDETAPGVTAAQNNINSVQGKEVTITAKFTGISGLLLNPETRNSFSIDSNEKGTQNFRGGLALVNDERGISDPRELIIDKGRAFIPQGRDVLIPLSKGAKVYTASQTKAMMSALGIPRYASGKDNSEEFISARDNWDHYTKTHAVTTLEELKKWVELSEQFTWNEQDRLDIEEQIFSLSQKYTEELNEQSKSYISDRSFLNDWEEYGDSAEDAFSRVQKRNKTLFDEGKITWEEYTKTMSDVGSNMYDERRSQSERWLEHEEEYNNMSVSDYLSGIDRMKEYTQEYYEMGIIDKRQYIEEMTSLDEQYIDKSREAMSDRFDISESWIGEHTYFNDWDEIGDSPLDAYNRVKEYILESDLAEEEKSEQLKSLSSQMYDERKEQSLNWLEEQRKYFGMTEDEYIAGLERIRKYTQEYFDLELISRQEYNESMTELKHAKWDEEASIYDDLLAEQSEYISNLRAKFSEEEQALQDSWTVEDREESLSDINRQLDIYRNAVTEQGKEKYQSILDEKKRLEREEELYNLQKSNNETIEKLQQEYNYLEENKADILLSLRNDTFDIQETERLMQRSIESANNSLTLAAADSNNFLRDIYNTLKELPKMMSGGGSTYNDSRNINITTWDSGNGIYKYINGEFSGLGSYMYNGKVY